MPIDIYDSVQARLTAYIAPNTPRTKAQKDAFDQAVEAQADYEKSLETAQVGPANAQSYSENNDGVSVSVSYAARAGAAYSESTLHPYVWALLKNAGLLRKGAIPTARRA